ncbi:MAG: hypothetical protein HY898_31810 [Deltaproteobacteria bacterium]|nr:hypothetical protein [Deltaproteobacteria bacterium]
MIATAAGCAAPNATRSQGPERAASQEDRVAFGTGEQVQVAPGPRARRPEPGKSCGLHWTPRDVGSVLIIHRQIMGRVMSSVLPALCACTSPGEFLPVVAQIDFYDGEARLRAPTSPPVDGCLAQVPVTFEPFRPDGPASDCIGCGPRRYGVLHGSQPVDTPEPAARIRMVYPIALDRSDEVMTCDAGAHAEKGRCEPDVAAAQPTVAPGCGCGPADLRCAIDCVSGSSTVAP